jgi:hypothetical protein
MRPMVSRSSPNSGIEREREQNRFNTSRLRAINALLYLDPIAKLPVHLNSKERARDKAALSTPLATIRSIPRAANHVCTNASCREALGKCDNFTSFGSCHAPPAAVVHLACTASTTECTRPTATTVATTRALRRYPYLQISALRCTGTLSPPWPL